MIYLNNLTNTNPVVSRKVGGMTKQGREIVQIIISSSQEKPSNKSVIFFECGIHAREWISPATCLYAIIISIFLIIEKCFFFTI